MEVKIITVLNFILLYKYLRENFSIAVANIQDKNTWFYNFYFIAQWKLKLLSLQAVFFYC